MPTTSGAKALGRVQFAQEAVAGTAVAAEERWRGIARFPKDARGKEQPEENIGFTSQTSRQHDLFLLAEMEFPETTATFEQLLHLLEASVMTATPVQDGAGSGYIYQYDMPTGDAVNIKTYTLEGGNNKHAERMEYGLVKEWTLAGRKKETLKMSAMWEGRQTADFTFTASTITPAVQAIKFQKSKLYIDNVGGTLGATWIQNSFLDFSLKYTSGWYLSHVGDGEMYPKFAEFVGAKAELTLTLLHNATTKAERDLWKLNTPRKIRIQSVGETAFVTPGSVYTYPTLNIDLAGVYTAFDPPNDEDEGANVYKVTFQVGYDSTAGFAFRITDVAEKHVIIPSFSPSRSVSPSLSPSSSVSVSASRSQSPSASISPS